MRKLVTNATSLSHVKIQPYLDAFHVGRYRAVWNWSSILIRCFACAGVSVAVGALWILALETRVLHQPIPNPTGFARGRCAVPGATICNTSIISITCCWISKHRIRNEYESKKKNQNDEGEAAARGVVAAAEHHIAVAVSNTVKN